jgi:hypothetical protein
MNLIQEFESKLKPAKNESINGIRMVRDIPDSVVEEYIDTLPQLLSAIQNNGEYYRLSSITDPTIIECLIDNGIRVELGFKNNEGETIEGCLIIAENIKLMKRDVYLNPDKLLLIQILNYMNVEFKVLRSEYRSNSYHVRVGDKKSFYTIGSTFGSLHTYINGLRNELAISKRRILSLSQVKFYTTKFIHRSISIQELLNKADKRLQRNQTFIAVSILDACVVKSFDCVDKIDDLRISEVIVQFSPKHVAQMLIALDNNKSIHMPNYYGVCEGIDNLLLSVYRPKIMKNSRFV